MVKKAKAKSDKAKEAMANRGTFESKHTNYGKPIHYKVAAAVEPFSFASAAAAKVWGDTLVDCVPPAYALRYRELRGQLEAAMVAEDYTLCVELATSLIKALKVMNVKARRDGHEPPKVDGHIAEFKGKTYCFLASGDLAAVRRKYPTWAVYHISEVCAVMSVRTDEMMAAVTKEFAGAKVVEVRVFDDEINFEPTGE
jgi:hypothetical protein